MRVPDFLSQPQLLGTVSILPVNRDYIFSRWLPFQDVATDDVLINVTQEENPMAPFVALGSQVPTTQNDLVSQLRAAVAYIRARHEFQETDFKWFTEEFNGLNGTTINNLRAQARREILGEVQKLRDTVEARLEWMRVQALTGTLTYNAEDLDISVTFPGTNPFTAANLWTAANAATATPVADIETWLDAIADTSGVRPSVLVMSDVVALNLASITQIQALWSNLAGRGGTLSTITRSMATQTLGNVLGIEIIVYNPRFTTRTYAGADGTAITINKNRFLPVRTVLALPAEPVGRMLTSPGPAELGARTGLYTWEDSTHKVPFKTEVGVGFHAFPAIWDPHKIGVFTV